MHNKASATVRTGAAVLAILLTLAACGTKDPAAFVASAKSYIAKGDFKAAIIEAKNALQSDRDNGEARLLLATALLESGDPVGAEAELRKAIDLKVPNDRTYPLLGRSLIAQHKFDKAADELGVPPLASASARADVGVSRAIAAFARGDREQARTLLDAALVDEPRNVRALLLQADFAGQGGNLAAAGKFVDSALEAQPDSLDALMMKANIALAAGKRDDAQKLFEQAIAAHPQSVSPRYPLISLAVSTGKMDLAKEQLAKVKQLAPRDVRTNYSDALVAAISHDNARAREALQRVLAVQPDHLPGLLMSGLIDLELGSYASGEDSLRKVIARVPDEPSASRALAVLYLRRGLPSQALDMLGPALKRSPDNALLLRTAGEAYLAMGDASRAAGSYERANSIDKNNIGSQVRLAQVRLAAGETDRALGDLQSLTANESNSYQADLALFTAHMRRREFDKALAVSDALAKKQPALPLAPTMRGLAYVGKRDLKNARASFEQALQVQADYIPAMQNLALLDLREGKLQSARERYDRMLAKDPKNEEALLALADLQIVTGAPPDKVRQAFDKAITVNPGSVRARLALINYNLRQRDGKAAVAAAQTALDAFPNDIRLLDALAVAQRASGDADAALATYRKAVQSQPDNAALLQRLAQVQAGTKDYAGAVESLRKALALKPDMVQAWGELAKVHMLSGHADAAVAEAKKLQKDRPDKAVGFALEGEVLLAQKKWAEAAAAFRQALSRDPAPFLAVRTYLVLQAAGKTADATAFGDKWIKDHPKDPMFLQMLAEQSQQRKDNPAAIAGYKRVLAVDSDNLIALNNLAWLLATNKDPAALGYAEQAHRLAPFNPNVLDTLGYALARNGDPKRAVEFLRMASSLSPAQDDIRLHLAEALAASGDKAGARKELAELTKPEKAPAVRSEAEKLQGTL